MRTISLARILAAAYILKELDQEFNEKYQRSEKNLMKRSQNLLPYVLPVFSELLYLLHLLCLLSFDLGSLTVNLPACAVHHPLVLLHGLYIER